MQKPLLTEYPKFYQNYINLVKEGDIFKILKEQVLEIQALVSQIPEEKENYAYAEGKWKIKEVIGHIIDTERVLAYRAMCFARKDKTPLPGFNENLYVENADANKQTLYALAHEFAIVRESNLLLFKNFDEEALDQIGNANGVKVSPRAIIFMIAGHAIHHINILKTRYLFD